jgi:hypothetical protein
MPNTLGPHRLHCVHRVHLLTCWALFAALSLGACGGGGDGSSPPPATPSVSINVSPSSIPAGQSATLTWSSTNASACSASGAWTDPPATSGSLGVSPPASGTYIYTLSCSASGSPATTASATLTVMPAPLMITTATSANGVIGNAYSETIQATGGVAPFVWTVSSGALPHNLSLSASTTSTVTISGVPDTVAQGVAFTIQVMDSAHHVATQSYTVSILLQPDTLVLSPASLDFGNELVGSASGALTETLTNTATSALIVDGMTIDNGGSGTTEFKQVATTCGATLAAGASCAVDVTFTPSQSGPRTATLTIYDNTAGSPQTVSLIGVGLTPAPTANLSADALPFGTQLVGTTSPALSVALNNYGTATLNVSSITTTSSFSETDDCVPTVVSGGTCTIQVRFTPGASGAVAGTLSIADDAAGNPQKLPLSGTGSTNTPLLTGNCVEANICVKVPSAQCPVGQPAETPMKLIWKCGPIIVPGTVPVDLARACKTARVGGGYCGTQ